MRWKTSLWARTYRERMVSGLEYCRNCRKSHRPEMGRGLTFAHLIAKDKNGGYSMDNISILCAPCNTRQGTRVWPTLFSLADEERTAPRGRQWASLAIQRVNALNDTSHNRAKRWVVDVDDDIICLEWQVPDSVWSWSSLSE